MNASSKISLLIVLSVLLSLGTFTGSALAEEPKAMPKLPMASLPGPINWSALNLTAIQSRKINLLRLNYNQHAVKLKADIIGRKLEIEKQIISPAANPERIRQLLQDQLVLEGKLKTLSLDHFLAIKKLLTAEQLILLSKARVVKPTQTP